MRLARRKSASGMPRPALRPVARCAMEAEAGWVADEGVASV